MSQPALSQMENSDNPRSATLEKLAETMGVIAIANILLWLLDHDISHCQKRTG